MPSAMQCAAVKIRSPVAECSTEPVHVCNDCPPRKIAPTRGSGSTGSAVAVAVAVTEAEADGKGTEEDVEGFACGAAGSPHDVAMAAIAASKTTPARRMTTDLARRSRTRQRVTDAPAAATCSTVAWGRAGRNLEVRDTGSHEEARQNA
jgi:hypothetical protein